MSKHNSPRLFAVIPAAGHSRRMGQPKLIMRLGNRTVIRRLLDALDLPAITATVVVARKNDQALQAEVNSTQAILVQPHVDPPDMRSSVEHALRVLEDRFSPDENDGWLLCPADHPVLNADTLQQLITAWLASPESILVPFCEGRRGHPTIFPWSLANDVFAIPSDHGLNHLLKVRAKEIIEFPISNPAVLTDLDRPDDFQRLKKQLGDNSN